MLTALLCSIQGAIGGRIPPPSKTFIFASLIFCCLYLFSFHFFLLQNENTFISIRALRVLWWLPKPCPRFYPRRTLPGAQSLSYHNNNSNSNNFIMQATCPQQQQQQPQPNSRDISTRGTIPKNSPSVIMTCRSVAEEKNTRGYKKIPGLKPFFVQSASF